MGSSTKTTANKSGGKSTRKPANKSGANGSKSKSTKSTETAAPSRVRVPELAEISEAARLLCCFNGPRSKRVETTQANPSTSRVALVVAAIGKGRKRAADTLGGKTPDEDGGKRLGFATLAAAEEYAAGRVPNKDVPVQTRRAMGALARRVAVADGGTRKPAQTKVNGRVLVAILVALAKG